MAELTLAPKMLLIMVTVMVFVGLVDFALLDVGGTQLYSFNTSIGGRFTDDGTINGSFIAGYDDVSAPSADSVDEDTGNIFTDTFKSLRGWWEKLERKFGLATSILRQPAGLLKDIGVPIYIVNAFAIIWYSLASLAVIMLFAGRN